jgi:hypothetical protein
MPKRKPTGNMINDTMREYKQWSDWKKQGEKEREEAANKEYRKHLGGKRNKKDSIKIPKGGRVEIK